MERKHHTESTVRAEEQGVVARCECGWVSGYHITSLAASAALMDHRERESQGNSWGKSHRTFSDGPSEYNATGFDADGRAEG